MTAPAFQAIGTMAGGYGNATPSPAWPTHAVDDVAILMIETANESVSLSTPAGFSLISSWGTGTVGDQAAGCALTLYWCRATSTSMAAPTVADSGAHNVAQIITVRGCHATGNPINAYARNAEGTGTGTAITCDAATTTHADALVMAIAAHTGGGIAPTIGSWANATLDGGTTTERGDGYKFVSMDETKRAGIAVATGTLAAAGSTGATTATHDYACVKSEATLAFLAPYTDGALAATIGSLTSTAAGTVLVKGAGLATLGALTGEATNTAAPARHFWRLM